MSDTKPQMVPKSWLLFTNEKGEKPYLIAIFREESTAENILNLYLEHYPAKNPSIEPHSSPLEELGELFKQNRS